MRKALLLTLASLFVAASLLPAGAVQYRFRELPDLGGPAVTPRSMNNDGVMVGNGMAADRTQHGIVWNADGNIVDLGYTSVYDINDSGQLLCNDWIGNPYLMNADGSIIFVEGVLGDWDAVRMNNSRQIIGSGWSDVGLMGFVCNPTDLPVYIAPLPGDVESVPMAINNVGVVAGASKPMMYYGLPYAERAFVWSLDTGTIQLESPTDASIAYPNAINDSGIAVGYLQGSGYTWPRGVVWDAAGRITYLGDGTANDINSSGRIAFWSATGASCVIELNGNRSVLEAPAGAARVVPVCINDAGVVGGYIDTTGGTRARYACVWEPLSVVIVEVAMTPPVLNLKAKGKWVSCIIELPADATQTLQDIDVTSVKLQDGIPAGPSAAIGDADMDGVPDLTLNFDRVSLLGTLSLGPQVIKLTGKFTDGASLQGQCTIQVKGK